MEEEEKAKGEVLGGKHSDPSATGRCTVSVATEDDSDEASGDGVHEARGPDMKMMRVATVMGVVWVCLAGVVWAGEGGEWVGDGGEWVGTGGEWVGYGEEWVENAGEGVGWARDGREWVGDNVVWAEEEEDAAQGREWVGENAVWAEEEAQSREWVEDNVAWTKEAQEVEAQSREWVEDNVAWTKEAQEVEAQGREWVEDNVAWTKEAQEVEAQGRAWEEGVQYPGEIMYEGIMELGRQSTLLVLIVMSGGLGVGFLGRSLEAGNEMSWVEGNDLLFMTTYLVSDGIERYDCLNRLACLDDHKAQQLLTAAMMMIKGAKYLRPSTSRWPWAWRKLSTTGVREAPAAPATSARPYPASKPRPWLTTHAED
ncbi:hypothetical protein Hamer_G012843 [Homarus americanus]|uniref:Uncharacterized protein n=1 Tax=Homarus americanus TaxID=6706 RepID=A0A8J5KAU8_HOMAM|nr:hypothetical protein Hamer_G012843 [Homarus americanus]